MAAMPRLTVATSASDRQVDAPTAEEVVAAIEELHGDGEVGLGEPTGIWLGVAGGPDRYFVGYADAQAGLTLQARAEEADGHAVEALIGGQPTTLPPAYLVPIHVATAAALHFLEAEEPAPAVTWHRM
jgi:hypothetical protein